MIPENGLAATPVADENGRPILPRPVEPSMHILLVEDDPDIAAIARLALEEVGGLGVTVAADGQAGVAAAHGRGPDLAVLDDMLPDGDGPGTLAALRAIPGLEGLRAVYLTANTGDTERLSGPGVLGIIEKPFDPMGLADRLLELAGDP
jgi:CheY-like chemotaxis protein